MWSGGRGFRPAECRRGWGGWRPSRSLGWWDWSPPSPIINRRKLALGSGRVPSFCSRTRDSVAMFWASWWWASGLFGGAALAVSTRFRKCSIRAADWSSVAIGTVPFATAARRAVAATRAFGHVEIGASQQRGGAVFDGVPVGNDKAAVAPVLAAALASAAKGFRRIACRSAGYTRSSPSTDCSGRWRAQRRRGRFRAGRVR